MNAAPEAELSSKLGGMEKAAGGPAAGLAVNFRCAYKAPLLSACQFPLRGNERCASAELSSKLEALLSACS